MNRPVGLRYETDRTRTIWFSTGLKQVQEIVDQQIPEMSNTLIALEPERGRFLIQSQSDRQPFQIRFLDLEKRSLTTIYNSRPAIDSTKMAVTEPLTIKSAGNGRLLRGFLTKPNGLKPPYPTIVLLSQTPRHPTYWDFDPVAQFLANRGYAVLRIKTRGSTGYGDDFSNKRLGDIEGMTTDVEDSVNWVIGEGLVDPGRIAIAGSYLGAAIALNTVATHPGLFRCALVMDGFLDLQEYVTSRKALSSHEYEFINGLRSLKAEDRKSKLMTLSALRRTGSIDCPTLVVYDPRPASSFGSNRDARQLIGALEERNVAVERFESTIPFEFWTEPADDDESAQYAQSFEAFYQRIETFLDRYL